MSVAVVEQSLVNSYLDRVQRFVDNVNAFKDRLDQFISEQASPAMGQQEYGMADYEPVQETVEEFSSSYDDPVEDNAVITADDVDIDALLSDIDLNGDYAL